MNTTAKIMNVNQMNQFLTADYITSHLIPALRQPVDDDLVSIPFLDLEVVFKVEVENSAFGIGTFKLTKELAKRVGLDDADYLKECAMNRVAGRVMISDMADLIGITGDGGAPMKVLTMSHNAFGAAAMLLDEAFLRASEELGAEELFVLPSSIHEVICIPDDGCVEVEALNRMVVGVNSTMVAPDEILSNHAYRFSKTTGLVSA